ncbi:hypothetical protein B9Z55_014131 [Caenorhabditis nigoni]|uniref:Reverse transcriptase domain-containing protein n=1 Tax=Caenorhabditis nigoni TaxID=1611254 RepID=A0A2G5U4Q5_9PELO|nr:hypothetical protein B9Z55_014131 [Caenorhabditis nigoni]
MHSAEMSSHRGNASLPSGGEASEACSGEGGRPQKSTPLERSEAKHSFAKIVSSPMVSPELPTQVQDCVKFKQLQVKESNVSEEVIPDDRFKDSFVAKRMNTDTTSSSQTVDSSGIKSISSTTEVPIVHPIGRIGEEQSVQDKIVEQQGSDQPELVQQGAPTSVVNSNGAKESPAEAVESGKELGGEIGNDCIRQTSSSSPAVVPLGQEEHRSKNNESASPKKTDNGNGTPLGDSKVVEDMKEKNSENGDGLPVTDDNGSDQAQEGQDSSGSSVGDSGEGGRINHSTPSGFTDGDKVKFFLKASELEQLAILMMKEVSRSEVMVRPHCNQEFQNFRDSLWSCDGACSFKDVSTDEDRTVLFLALSVKEERDCAVEAQKELINRALENLIEKSMQRSVNFDLTERFKEDLLMLKETEASMQASSSSREEDCRKDASNGGMFRTPSLRAQQVASSSTWMLSKWLSTSADSSVQRRQWQAQVSKTGNNSSKGPGTTSDQWLINEAGNKDSYPDDSSFEKSEEHKQCEIGVSGEQGRANKTISSEDSVANPVQSKMLVANTTDDDVLTKESVLAVPASMADSKTQAMKDDSGSIIDLSKRDEVTEEQVTQLRQLLECFTDVFSRSTDESEGVESTPIRKRSTKGKSCKGRLSKIPDKCCEEPTEELQKNNNGSTTKSSTTRPIVRLAKKEVLLNISLDRRKLIGITVPDWDPSLRIGTVIEKATEAKYFSLIGEVTGTEAYAFFDLPSDTESAATPLQHALTLLMTGLDEHVMINIDDVLIFSNTYKEHLITIEKILSKLRRFNLKTSPKRCVFVGCSIDVCSQGHTSSHHTTNRNEMAKKLRGTLSFFRRLNNYETLWSHGSS